MCGVDPDKYFSSGILLMNLEEFRREKIVEKFIYLMNTYNFDVVDPDQAYLNFLCYGKVKHLPNGWNKQSLPTEPEGPLNIVHYALYKKPWQYDDVVNDNYFWHYANSSPLLDRIMAEKNGFTEEKKLAKDKANIDIVVHAEKIVNEVEKTFYNKLIKEGNWLEKIAFDANGECFMRENKVEA